MDGRIRALGHAAIAGLPASKRSHPAASFDGFALERLVGAMRAWVGGLGLDHAGFAARFFDRHPSSPVVERLRRAAGIVSGATTSAEVREAAAALAAAMLAVGLDGWPRFLKDAHERAMAAANTARVVQAADRDRVEKNSKEQEELRKELHILPSPTKRVGGVEIPVIPHSGGADSGSRGTAAPAAQAGVPPAAKPPAVSSRDIADFRTRIRVPKTDTVGVARTNVPGLEGQIFGGVSPAPRREGGLPSPTTGPIVSPRANPMFRNHAEEDIANQFVKAVERAGLRPADLEGKELLMRIQNKAGICTACRQGLKNPNVPPGVLKQLSQRYPGLSIHVMVDNPGPGLRGLADFVVRNGVYVQ